MKKFLSFALIFMSLIGCVIFSACKKDYSTMEMRFFNMAGEPIEKVDLFISANGVADEMQLRIQFDGIDEEDIGEIMISSQPSQLITLIGPYSYSNDSCYVKIKPNAASSRAKLLVTHLASNKVSSINLNIKQQSNSILKLNDDYIISIPEEVDGVNEHRVDTSKLVKLLPIGSSDNVYFKSDVNFNSLTGIDPIYQTFEVDGETYEYISGFNVEARAVETAIQVYPVTYLEWNGEVFEKEYPNEKIMVTFAHLLSQENVQLTSDDKHQGYLTTNDQVNYDCIHLIANDSTNVEDLYSYNNFKIGFGVGQAGMVTLEAIDEYLKYYDITATSSTLSVVAMPITNQVLVQALAYTPVEESVEIVFEPKTKFVGEIAPVTKVIKVKGEMRSKKIDVSMGSNLQMDDNIDIYDYYSQGSSLGALFNFEAVATVDQEVFADLKQMVLKIHPSIVNYKGNVYDDQNFETKHTYDPANSVICSQKYVLDVYKFTEPLKFYYDQDNAVMISEPFDENVEIYVKYVETSNRDASRKLAFDVETILTSELDYLKDIKPTVRSLSFERKSGIKSMLIEAGYEEDATTHVLYGVQDVQTLYLDKTKGVDTAEKPNFLYFETDAIKGLNDKVLAGVDINVKIKANFLNLAPIGLGLKLLEKFDGDDEFGVENQEFVYNHQTEAGATEDKRRLYIGFNKDTEIGEYEIVFTQPDTGFEKKIIVQVYQSVTDEDLTAIFATNGAAFENDDGEGNKFEGYTSDYIVAAGQEIAIEQILNDDILKSNIVKGYGFTFSIDVDNATYNHKDYFDVVQDDLMDNVANMKFKKGTYIDGENRVVTLTLGVQTQEYVNIVTLKEDDADPEASKQLTFFIYEPISMEDVTMQHDGTIKFMEDYLGVYDKNAGKAVSNLEVKMAEGKQHLWNYIQGGVTWLIDGETQEGITDKTLRHTFGKNQTSEDYQSTIIASVHQFNSTVPVQVKIAVKKPIITEKLVLKSNVNIAQKDGEDRLVINLKQGDSYQVDVSQFSSDGKVSNPGIVIQVVDGDYSAIQNIVTIESNTNTIRVGENVKANMKLIIFAKDAMRYEAKDDVLGYDEPSQFMLVDNDSPNKYKNAYLMIDLDLSDGKTDATAYQIYDANDFWDINSSDASKGAHYRLMNDINIQSTDKAMQAINEFKGRIFSKDYIFTIYNVVLNNNLKNLFTKTIGSASAGYVIENVRFAVSYEYNELVASNNDLNLGIIGENNRNIKNVFVEISGSSSFARSGYQFNFGGLVGSNNGTIIYSSDDLQETYVGTNGSVNSLTGGGAVKFGGLVGLNSGAIHGFNLLSENASISIGAENAVSNLEINSNFTNPNSAIGGVVGYNTGEISNIYATGEITGNYNVGGIIGENVFEESVISITIDGSGYLTSVSDPTYKLTNLVSNVLIDGGTNVGGITGKDVNGTYMSCKYQIIPRSIKTSAIIGGTNVGGIAGYSMGGRFKFCSVYSYIWDYSKRATTFDETADIVGESFVGGMVGFADGKVNTLTTGTSTYGVAGSNDELVSISYSSVNAFVKSNKTDNPYVGGIISSSAGIHVGFSVYFMGKIEGGFAYETSSKVDGKLALANNANMTVNHAYSINVEIIGSVKYADGTVLNYAPNNSENLPNINWAWDENLNDGKIYLREEKAIYESMGLIDEPTWGANKDILFVLDDVTQKYEKVQASDVYDATREYYVERLIWMPIFDVAPTKIDATIKTPTNEDSHKILNENTIALNYYDFSGATSDANIIKKLNETYNTYSINSGDYRLFDIETTPSGIPARINVKSSNNGVVRVTADGRLIVEGVGQCVLTFESVLNPNVYDEIIVNVTYPIGDLVLSKSAVDASKEVGIETGKELKIAKNMGKQLYLITSGSKDLSFVSYSYKTLANMKLKVEVSIDEDDLDGKTISYYLSISGVAGEETEQEGNKVLTVYLNEKTPLSINVNDSLPDVADMFNFKVTPYEEISCNVDLKDDEKEFAGVITRDLTEEKTFNLQTAIGPTKISANMSSAVIYPNDIVILELTVDTDIELTTETEIWKALDGSGFELYKSEEDIFKDEIKNSDIIKYLDYTYDNITKKQTIRLQVKFNESHVGESGKSTLTANFVLKNNGESAYVEYTLLNQRINVIEIKNYIVNGSSLEQTEILKPASERATNGGRIIIDLAPNNAYYDYLEIKDITGNEEIKFIQVTDPIGGGILGPLDESTADGKGIKLVKVKKDDGTYDLRTYVSTQISKNYSSKIHTIEVKAFLSDRTELASGRYYIDVKMLPSVTVEYLLPDLSVGVEAEDQEVTGQYLANGTSAQFRVATKNATSLDEPVLVGGDNKYEIVSTGSNASYRFYELKPKDVAQLPDDGTTLTVKFKAYAEFNESFEETEASIQFTLIEFMIHNFSIVDAGKDEIYGNTETTRDIEIYFSGTDVSFAGVDRNANYRYNETNDLPTALKGILSSINTNANEYLNLNVGFTSDVNGLTYTTSSNWTVGTDAYILQNNELQKNGEPIISLVGNQLTVKEEVAQPIYLAVNLRLKLNNLFAWEISNVATGTQFTKNFELKFVDKTSFYKPKLVATAQDFLKMASGPNNHYILGDDIELVDYSPIDVDIASFDGNGRTITIKSFAPFTEEQISAGLFKDIAKNMLVKNLTVIYTGDYNSFGKVANDGTPKEFADLCNNDAVNFTSAMFGGLTPKNEGVITNCIVKGEIAMRASAIEAKKTATGSGYSIDFNMGGLVGVNSGHITHSDSELSIYALANIGGFVYLNSGKISSCERGSANIYTYNPNLDRAINTNVGAFVMTNNGLISMSAVDMKDTAKMSVKDVSAGFVHTNSGDIQDCYVNIPTVGVNNNTFAGFVFANSGNIKTSYSCINNGKGDNNNPLFALANMGGIENCIEINNSANNGGFTSGVEGLKSIVNALRTQRTQFEDYGFAFGNNKSAIWIEHNNDAPKLISVEDKIRYTDDKDPEGDKSKYYGLQNIVREKSGDDEFDYEYVTKPGNYGSKENPYIIHNLETWNYYFENNSSAYYRIVNDIDFGSIGGNPKTSTMTFKGNIEGNNMKLSNIMLKSNADLNSLGLFKDLVSAENVGIKNTVKNLTLSVSSAWATKTSSVGVLAGIVESFNLYNITIDTPNKVLVGGNAVGGVAGIVRGSFDIDGISSNIGVNSTISTSRYRYELYISKNNLSYENASYNLSGVYYAGSAFGILDGYDRDSFNINATRDISTNYFKVRNISISGAIVAIGDSVGGAIGFVGERVRVDNVKVMLNNAILSGSQYSAGVAGENRGVINNATIEMIGDETFDDSVYVSAGAVGLNLGGLVQNVKVKGNILKKGSGVVVAGVVGRNMNGNVNNVSFDGQLSGAFVGGIVGGNYSKYEIFTSSPSGSGALLGEKRILESAIPTNEVDYTDITNMANLKLSKATVDYFLTNAKRYYSFREKNSFDESISMSRVLGLAVGLSDGLAVRYLFAYDNSEGYFVINLPTSDNQIDDINDALKNIFVKVENSALVSATDADIEDEDILTFEIEEVREISYSVPKEVDGNVHLLFTTGAYIQKFDTWDGKLSANDKLIFNYTDLTNP